jgi:phosphoribosylamine---glycine ligase
MNVLLIGSGGRECAFAWKLSQSKQLSQLFIAPGNAGTRAFGTNVAIKETDFDAIKDLVLKEKITLVIVGPEAPLVKGIRDFFENDEKLKAIPVIGPDKKGAMLEGSKDFSKAFMNRHGVPTAKSFTVTKDTLAEGERFLESLSAPYVLKADGLAAGKGVIITDDLNDAKSQLKEMLGGMFGEAGDKVLIEEFLDGIELSVFVLTDGISYVILPEAKDYKRIGEKDTGPNTGGMGAVSPVPFAGKEFMQRVESEVVIPTIEGLKKEKIDYVGFIFIGLMNVKGKPLVIEYNCRMGDPETEVVIPRIENDLLELFVKVGKKELKGYSIKHSNDTAMTIMAVSGGYPGSFDKGYEIKGLEKITEGIAFHAGTALADDKSITNGGRVLALTCKASDLKEAREKCLSEIEKISFEKMYYRKDIGLDLLGSN